MPKIFHNVKTVSDKSAFFQDKKLDGDDVSAPGAEHLVQCELPVAVRGNWT